MATLQFRVGDVWTARGIVLITTTWLMAAAQAVAMEDPVAGRWLSRDPQGTPLAQAGPTPFRRQLRDSLSARAYSRPITLRRIANYRDTGTLYMFEAANPSAYCDPSGKCNSTTACADYAISPPADDQEPPPGSPGNQGGVLCCDGQQVACAWTIPFFSIPAVQVCIRAHELDHFDDVDPCPPCGLSRPPYRNEKETPQAECHAYHLEYQCLEAAEISCSGDDCDVIDARKNYIHDVALSGFGCELP